MNYKEVFKPGTKVTYRPLYGNCEHGIVKTIVEEAIFVVYKCDGNWDSYTNYTASLTHPKRLELGWNK